MPWRIERVCERPAQQDPGPDPGRRADQRDDRRLPGDHAADLTGRRGHRPQQRDLALALLDRQAQRAGHDEHRDEHRQPAECRRDRDQRRARLLELRVLGRAARAARQHLRAAGGRAQAETSKPGAASTPIASTRPGWPASRVASASVRKIAVCWETGWRGRATPTTVTVRAGLGGRQGQPRTERGGIAGDDLVGPGGRHVRRSARTASARRCSTRGRRRPCRRAGPAPTRRRSPPGLRARPPAARRARSSPGRAR